MRRAETARGLEEGGRLAPGRVRRTAERPDPQRHVEPTRQRADLSGRRGLASGSPSARTTTTTRGRPDPAAAKTATPVASASRGAVVGNVAAGSIEPIRFQSPCASSGSGPEFRNRSVAASAAEVAGLRRELGPVERRAAAFREVQPEQVRRRVRGRRSAGGDASIPAAQLVAALARGDQEDLTAALVDALDLDGVAARAGQAAGHRVDGAPAADTDRHPDQLGGDAVDVGAAQQERRGARSRVGDRARLEHVRDVGGEARQESAIVGQVERSSVEREGERRGRLGHRALPDHPRRDAAPWASRSSAMSSESRSWGRLTR